MDCVGIDFGCKIIGYWNFYKPDKKHLPNLVSGFKCLWVNCGKTLSNINEQLLNRDEQNKGNGGEKYVNFPSEKS